ncbi:kelch-like protein 10 [Protopterus annectens]|uniref:kelch-like protein 10 n=1 Tax=Protopterus annectens TaxID=7888 RepID=UPI001CFC33A5|nr:kelch-like protein 10 [Protopterus annectens]
MEKSSTPSGLEKVKAEKEMSAMDCDFFNELRLDGKLCDVILKVKGKRFKAHKNILCSCSTYFRNLFTRGGSKTEKSVYNIVGVSPDLMNMVIEYAYTRNISITADNVDQLWTTAYHFGVLGIVRACSKFLISQLCPENCIKLYTLADSYDCNELKCKAYNFILRNFEEMVEVSKDFLQLPASKLGEIIDNDELNAKKEEVVFEAIVKWIANDAHNRKKCMSVLLPKVRVALLDDDYFMSNVKNNDYVKDSKDCKAIIINAIKVKFDLKMNGPSNQDFRLIRPRLPDAILFAFGGWNDDIPTNVIETYDARADRWVDVTCKGERPRAGHGAAYLKGYVYLIGGHDGKDYLSTVRCFNPVKMTWQQVAPMYLRRCYVSVAVLNDFIYAMGGYDGYVHSNSAEQYSPEKNQWALISSMNAQRTSASATSLHGKVYICGGFTGNEYLSTAEVYNPVTSQWTLITPMGSRRCGVGVIAYADQVYAMGGFDGNDYLCSAEVYSPITNTWHNIASMLSYRSSFGIEVVDNLIFVIGGWDGLITSLVNVECYDENTDEWYLAQELKIDRRSLSCCVIPDLPNVGQYVVPRNSFEEFLFDNEDTWSYSSSASSSASSSSSFCTCRLSF